MAVRKHECGSCGHEAQGYTRSELEGEGWKWNIARKGQNGVVETYFVLCDSCTGAAERRVEDRRERERRARVPRAECSHCKAETIVLPASNVVVGTEFNLALPTALCRRCDRYPDLLRTLAYTPEDWAMPDFFFPEAV